MVNFRKGLDLLIIVFQLAGSDSKTMPLLTVFDTVCKVCKLQTSVFNSEWVQ